MSRIRHGVECPRCRTRYLVSCSPYRNGSYLISTVEGGYDEYVLYCACRNGSSASRWRWDELQRFEVGKAVYDRGYGSPEEVTLVLPRGERWQFDAAQYLDHTPTLARSKKWY